MLFLAKLADFAGAALKLESEIRTRAERYRFMRQAVVIGRGLNYANSFEFALKLMETCYVVAERFSSADLLHGPIAMLESSFPAFVFAPAGVTWKPIRELLERLKSIQVESLLRRALHRYVAPAGTYWRAIAIRKRSSGEIRWSMSSFSRSIWIQLILPLNALPLGP